MGRYPLRVDPWVHYGTLAGLAVGLIAGYRLPILGPWIERFIWHPIVYDLGFNPVNTVLFMVVVAVGVAWWFTLMPAHGVQLDRLVVASGLSVFFTGILLRVLHDAEAFAPFDADVACIPGDGLLMGCAGVFFVTPILWILVASLLYPMGRIALAAQRRGATEPNAGIATFAIGPGAMLVGFMLSTRTPWTRAAPPTWWVALCCIGAVAWVAWRTPRGGLRWSEGMLVQTLALAAMVLWPAIGLLRDLDRPASLWSILAAAGLALLIGWQARHLGRQTTARPKLTAGLAAYLFLLQAAALAAALVAIAEGRPPWFWLAAIPLGSALIHYWPDRLGGHPQWRGIGQGAGIYIVAGQLLDAMSTGIGIDLLGAQEKHVLPRTLIMWLEPVLAGTALAPYPGMTAMLLYKVPVALWVAWALHVHGRRVLPPDLLLIIQMVLGTIGAAPGLRNTLRQAIGV